MFDIGGGELLLIVVAILLMFGPKKLPELSRMLGKGMRQLRNAQTEFQRSMNSITDEIDDTIPTNPYVGRKAPSMPAAPTLPKRTKDTTRSSDIPPPSTTAENLHNNEEKKSHIENDKTQDTSAK